MTYIVILMIFQTFSSINYVIETAVAAFNYLNNLVFVQIIYAFYSFVTIYMVYS